MLGHRFYPRFQTLQNVLCLLMQATHILLSIWRESKIKQLPILMRNILDPNLLPMNGLSRVCTVKWLSWLVMWALISVCQEVAVSLSGGLPATGLWHYQLQGVICILNGVIDIFVSSSCKLLRKLNFPSCSLLHSESHYIIMFPPCLAIQSG